jgi:uncharacterized protein (TIGR03790 family)
MTPWRFSVRLRRSRRLGHRLERNHCGAARYRAPWLNALILLLIPAGAIATNAPAQPTITLPRLALGASDIAIIVNDLDAKSRWIAEYYRAKRQVPAANVLRVQFRPGQAVMDPETFERIRAQIAQQTPPEVQAYALTWTLPYRVGCMSITSAFAFGYDPSQCAEGCTPTRESTYFASESRRPFDDLGLRPTMALAGRDLGRVKALIDRGVAADASRPSGTGYLVKTSDPLRSVRAWRFEQTQALLGGAVRLERIDADAIYDRRDVLFYFTGLASVPGIETNRFLPGAAADHLTSAGGQLSGSNQMSSLRWLDGRATGSYGTVVEPCNFLGKFPDPTLLIGAYVNGATLIEAYWKSVQMPGQGIFIGEPLARPFSGYRVAEDGPGWRATLYGLPTGDYAVRTRGDDARAGRTIHTFTKQRHGSQVIWLPPSVGAEIQIERMGDEEAGSADAPAAR